MHTRQSAAGSVASWTGHGVRDRTCAGTFPLGNGSFAALRADGGVNGFDQSVSHATPAARVVDPAQQFYLDAYQDRRPRWQPHHRRRTVRPSLRELRALRTPHRYVVILP